MESVKKVIIAFIRLSRIRVILFDYFWAILIASIIAVGFNISNLKLIAAIFISLSVHAYAFIVNDCEDAEDDAMDPKKAKRNPVSSGFITYRQGILLLQLTSFPALLLAYIISGPIGFLVILSAIVAGHLYSWKFIRLKSLPFIDVVSHSYALAMFQVLYFLVLPGAEISLGSVLIFYGVGLFSAGGALYNQVRDFEVDQKSGLNNTANVIGKDKTQILSYLCYILGAILAGIGIIGRLF